MDYFGMLSHETARETYSAAGQGELSGEARAATT
jgi:hypothetical protein